jgi:hypothetical protein
MGEEMADSILRTTWDLHGKRMVNGGYLLVLEEDFHHSVSVDIARLFRNFLYPHVGLQSS